MGPNCGHWTRAPPCPGPSVHLPDFLSIRRTGRAVRDTGWTGAGLSVWGHFVLELEPRLRRLGSFLMPVIPGAGSSYACAGFDSDNDQVWQGLQARPREAWECFGLTFSTGLTSNHLPGLYLHL